MNQVVTNDVLREIAKRSLELDSTCVIKPQWCPTRNNFWFSVPLNSSDTVRIQVTGLSFDDLSRKSFDELVEIGMMSVAKIQRLRKQMGELPFAVSME